MKFAIGIPTLNRVDLLYPSILLYKRDMPDVHIYIVDNGNQDTQAISRLVNVHVLKNESNIGVGASWNMLCRVIYEHHQHALIMNDDIYLGKSQGSVKEIIEKKKYKGAFVRSTFNWCAFLLNKSIYQKVGEFDECFMPAYYEDNSYEYRMKLKGIPVIKDVQLNPYVYRSSQTLEKDKRLIDLVQKNKELYIQMWGGEPQKEKFKTPFNK